MRNIKSLLMTSFMLVALSAVCRPPDNWKAQGPNVPQGNQSVSYRANCNQATQGTDLSINNVRARLLNGGDMWWDLNKGKYIVPQVQPGQPEVSSLYAGSVWLGGVDPGGNLKMACQLYRSGSKNDFWPGPLNVADGEVSQATCKQWDKFFRVLGENIRKHKAAAEFYKLRGEPYPVEEIPKDVKGWPSRGNPHFQEIHGFDLPSTNQGLALFYDAEPADGEYHPEDGDYPVIDVKGCPATTFPDEMIFWVYNDNGNVHTQTQANAIRMEVQVQAFGYSTQDELNDMTFYRYKLINRAQETIDSTFFAIWIDPDLGCSDDDYIGCDTVFVKVDTCFYDDAVTGEPKVKYIPRRRDLMYVYNQDAIDGISGCNCSVGGSNTNTYCNEVPILGVDYFRGPLDADGCELGMSSFVYWLREDAINAKTDPGVASEFYNYLTGRWKDGTPFTPGGSGYNLGSSLSPTKYALGSPPNDPNGWSMCTANLPKGDQRTLQASGPFTLTPGATNELIVGVPWVPNIQYPCPDLEPLLYADRLAQGLFDNCFKVIDGPTAPDLDWVELNREVICVLSNNIGSNNYKENYSEVDFQAPNDLTEAEKSYLFEGYRIYQMANPNVTRAELGDPDKARQVYQCDIKNGVSKIFNWEATAGPNGVAYWTPVESVDGNNTGVGHSFKITEDQFGSGSSRALVNHKKYYYVAIAYAYNNFRDFDPSDPTSGQRRNYLEGRLNVKTYTVIPRPIVDRSLQAEYGQGPEITRYEGVGMGNIAVELKPGEYDSILAGNNVALEYAEGKGPINVRIYDPLNVKDGEFELSIVDDNLTDNVLDANARWHIINTATGDTIFSERTLARLNEQLISEYGFSVTVAQTTDAGDVSDNNNGALDMTATFADPNNPWLGAIPETADALPGLGGATPFHFAANQALEKYNLQDPKQALTTIGNQWFVPYWLTWNPKPATQFDFKLSPRWSPPNTAFSDNTNQYTTLQDLNNVDIVFTKDKSKWSRCLIVETASDNYTGTSAPSLGFATQSGPTWLRKSMDTRYAPSVGKEDANGDGLPDPDGETDGGQPVLGMGWFPGYCIDVESGERLNIFFGENSIYNGVPDGGQIWPDEPANGADMMFNPTDFAVRPELQDGTGGLALFNPYSFPLGGQHFVYVTRQKYDGCAEMRQWMEPDKSTTTSKKYTNKIKTIQDITWTGMMMLPTGAKMTSYAEGLVPNDCTIKIRVDNPYGVKKTTTNGHPRYRFKISGKTAKPLDEIAIGNSLDSIKMVPNPYYGYSNYETSQFSNVIKISNLPAKCTVTIYSLDGKFIRQYNRDEIPQVDPNRTNQPVPARQYLPDVEWDMKNSKGIQVASGVYLVHVNAPGYGERTLKWFGIGREFDPSGL